MMVIRRIQIDEFQKSIDALRDSWSDLYSDDFFSLNYSYNESRLESRSACPA